MYELSTFGPITITAYRQGRKVPVATTLSIGEIEIPAPQDPRLLLIPENVRYLQQMWDALRMPSRNNLLITGESGTGKTTLVRYLGEIYRHALLARASCEKDPALSTHITARANSFQTRILTFHENLRRSDITERRHFGETGEEKTGWTMSDVMDGMVEGDWNVLSEINRTGEDVQAEFNEPLENKAKSLHQRVIRGHPDARFIATTNPIKSEGRGIYEGKVMSGEFMNRFTNKVHLSYLPPDQEFEVLKDYGPGVDDRIIEQLVAVANHIRKDYMEEHGVVPFPVTTRALIRIVRHLQKFPADIHMLRSLFWRKAYWLDDRIHPIIARKLITNLLDLYEIVDSGDQVLHRSEVVLEGGGNEPYLRIGMVSHPLGPGGPYVPDTVIEEVRQNIADLEWILKDIVLQENLILIGEAGVGKNKLESYLAHLLQWNLLVIGMSGETRVSDLLTYRSFGEEEEGRTGDTATLGLLALTDQDQQWIIVLDEANKAQPGVLVSFNDLLQDRLVRLPGGLEARVRATICVNINPNRPPYEVNDFSFEFMDRFSIHTIVHLPPDQAVDVLRKKYPDADVDFIRDIVNGYYALHPLYSGGVLFEPVTMRNEEAAIERGLQHPIQACNLIDLLCAGYSPRDARDQKAIRNLLQAEGFDRNTLAASQALEQYRISWEKDKNDEQHALTLAGTYRAIGKPSAALAVHREMISRHPGRDWVHYLRSALILQDCQQHKEAADSLKLAFATCNVVRMNNGEDYMVLNHDLRSARPMQFSIEARNCCTGCAALIISANSGDPIHSFQRSTGIYHHTFTDTIECLNIYECNRTDSDKGPDIPSALPGNRGPVPGPGPDNHPACLHHLVEDTLQLIGTGQGIHTLVSRLPSPQWSAPECRDGEVTRTLSLGDGFVRLCAGREGGWSFEFHGSSSKKIGWMQGEKSGSGELYFTSRTGALLRIPSPADPFIHLGYRRSDGCVFLILSDNPVSIVHTEWGTGAGQAGDLEWFLLSLALFRSQVLSPLLSTLLPRLHNIFRYARPLSPSLLPGAGDIMFTLGQDSEVSISLVTEHNGIVSLARDLTLEHETVFSIPAVIPCPVPVLPHVVIPFPQLDTCEAQQRAAFSDENQSYLKELRGYIASALILRTKPRDLGYEAKARAVLSGVGALAEPVATGRTVFGRGDILVRIDSSREGPNSPRSVFIVRFLQDDPVGRGGAGAVIRGFWLAEHNPVATEHLEDITGHFGRIIVDGDDKHQRIIERLVGTCKDSAFQWKFSRTGNRSEPVDLFELAGLVVEHHPMNRRLRITFPHPDGEGLTAIEETGYPADEVTISSGTSDRFRWKGTPIIGIRFLPDEGIALIVVDNDFLSFLLNNEILTLRPFGTNGVKFQFISRSDSESGGVILNNRK